VLSGCDFKLPVEHRRGVRQLIELHVNVDQRLHGVDRFGYWSCAAREQLFGGGQIVLDDVSPGFGPEQFISSSSFIRPS